LFHDADEINSDSSAFQRLSPPSTPNFLDEVHLPENSDAGSNFSHPHCTGGTLHINSRKPLPSLPEHPRSLDEEWIMTQLPMHDSSPKSAKNGARHLLRDAAALEQVDKHLTLWCRSKSEKRENDERIQLYTNSDMPWHSIWLNAYIKPLLRWLFSLRPRSVLSFVPLFFFIFSSHYVRSFNCTSAYYLSFSWNERATS
jgi:hypothetical protein